MTDSDWMKEAIAIARIGIENGQSPFGSIVTKGAKLIAKAHNTVWKDTDPTAHAEVNSIRAATRILKTVNLSGCTVYTTCEPCPMCLAAIHWANATRVVYGATIAMAAGAGFRELFVPAQLMVEMGRSKLIVVPLSTSESCQGLFDEWKTRGLSQIY